MTEGEKKLTNEESEKIYQESKKKLYDSIEKKTGVFSNPTTVREFQTLVAIGFPFKLFVQWKENCKQFYDGLHWIKIWSDHLKAKSYDMLTGNAVQSVQQEPVTEEEKEKVEEEIAMIGDPNGISEENGGNEDGKI